MRRIVVKLGTSTLTEGKATLSLPRMADLARQVSALRAQEDEVILVSSGAIAAGRAVLGASQLPKAIPAKQMLAAVGQPRLMDTWGRLFEIYGVLAAQVLLTRADLGSRRRYLNARSTLDALLRQRVIPIINENDTVATEEIRVGDNDNLSALVAALIDADLLILLTDQDGLYAEDPRRNPQAAFIERVDTPEIGEHLWRAAGGGGLLGTGGMFTKLQAADLARRAGVAVRIARGSTENVLLRIAAGEALGTEFSPTTTRMESFKRFLLAGAVEGTLTIDAGAARALRSGGSLLPAGLQQTDGDFERGAVVRIHDSQGVEVARGLAGYEARDCRKLAGRQSRQIETLLGYFYGDEIVHRDNLVLIK